MPPQRRDRLQARWDAIDRQLETVRRCSTSPDGTDLAALEDILLDRLDTVEFELGLLEFGQRESQ